MKKILFIPLLLLSLVSCSFEYDTITYEDTIVNKEIRSERDNVATWLWGQPMNKQVYYFKLEKYGEKSVSKSEYSSYNIGDTFTWEE